MKASSESGEWATDIVFVAVIVMAITKIDQGVAFCLPITAVVKPRTDFVANLHLFKDFQSREVVCG